MDIKATVTIFCDGVRGNLTKTLMQKLGLGVEGHPQQFAVGLKELWEVPESRVPVGTVMHTLGYPLRHEEFGGGFLYGMGEGLFPIAEEVWPRLLAGDTSRLRYGSLPGVRRARSNTQWPCCQAFQQDIMEGRGSPSVNLTGLCRSRLPGAQCLKWHRSHVDPDHVTGNTNPGS